jgi:chromosome segregation ATPase
MESEAYEIQTFDAVTGKTFSRTIQPLPQPQRLVKPEVPSLESLHRQLTELTEDITDATKDYDAVNADLDSFFAPHKSLEKRIHELRAALSEAEQELSELRSHGTPSEGYRRFVIEAETKVSGIARQLIDRVSADRARDKFDTDFHRLSESTQKDLQISIRLKLERFASQFYARLGQRNPNATIEQVKARASELLRDLQTIISENFSK